LAGGCGVDSVGSGEGPMTGSCDFGGELAGPSATELVTY
jgi:hypothetical protein